MNDSTIIVKSPAGWKIKVALGIFGLAVIVILAFLYRLEVGIIVLAIGLGAGARVWVWTIGHYRVAGYQWRQLEAETRRLEYEADKARIARHFLETNSGVFHIDHPTETIGVRQFYPAVSASRMLADVPQLALPEPAPRFRRLLDVGYVHMLIVGPTNSGKTTVANWLIENEVHDAAIYVLDPHNKFNVWPGRVSEIIGTGRNYAAIDAQLLELIGEMDRRYNSDSLRFGRILIVCDEWLSVLENCPSAGRFFDTIGSEARKVNMSLIISTTSATADDLNCTAATRDNLVQLTLNRTLKDMNQGELKWSRRDTEIVELPGLYSRGQGSGFGVSFPDPTPQILPPVVLEPFPELDPGPVAPTPTAKELRICELWDEGGRSQRAIYREVYGKEPGGGRQLNDEITEVLRRFGRVK